MEAIAFWKPADKVLLVGALRGCTMGQVSNAIARLSCCLLFGWKCVVTASEKLELCFNAMQNAFVLGRIHSRRGQYGHTDINGRDFVLLVCQF